MSTENNISNFINKELLQNAMQKYKSDSKLKVIDFSMSNATDKGDNYTSDIFRVNVKYSINGKNETKSVVIKVAPAEGVKKDLVFIKI